MVCNIDFKCECISYNDTCTKRLYITKIMSQNMFLKADPEDCSVENKYSSSIPLIWSYKLKYILNNNIACYGASTWALGSHKWTINIVILTKKS